MVGVVAGEVGLVDRWCGHQYLGLWFVSVMVDKMIAGKKGWVDTL